MQELILDHTSPVYSRVCSGGLLGRAKELVGLFSGVGMAIENSAGCFYDRVDLHPGHWVRMVPASLPERNFWNGTYLHWAER